MVHIPFAIVGAGIAGLACARTLRDAGIKNRVFDKGRAPGGRIATRRVETPMGHAQFDHGAQFFTARDSAFQTALVHVSDAIAPWTSEGAGEGWMVGAPGMSSFARALASDLDVHLGVRIETIIRTDGQYHLLDESGAIIATADAVLIATPAEQAAPLLAPHAPLMAQEARDAITAPCWAGLFAFEHPIATEHILFDRADHPVLAWAACDSAKPGRPHALQCWVAHAHAVWSRTHLEDAPEAICAMMLDALRDELGDLPKPVVAQAHRWRFAKVERPAGTAFAWDPALRIGACGDWRLGPRVELAWRSGEALAKAIAS